MPVVREHAAADEAHDVGGGAGVGLHVGRRELQAAARVADEPGGDGVSDPWVILDYIESES